jgi:hypothetical protein
MAGGHATAARVVGTLRERIVAGKPIDTMTQHLMDALGPGTPDEARELLLTVFHAGKPIAAQTRAGRALLRAFSTIGDPGPIHHPVLAAHVDGLWPRAHDRQFAAAPTTKSPEALLQALGKALAPNKLVSRAALQRACGLLREARGLEPDARFAEVALAAIHADEPYHLSIDGLRQQGTLLLLHVGGVDGELALDRLVEASVMQQRWWIYALGHTAGAKQRSALWRWYLGCDRPMSQVMAPLGEDHGSEELSGYVCDGAREDIATNTPPLRGTPRVVP